MPAIAIQREKTRKGRSRIGAIGSRISQNRSLGFGTKQMAESVDTQIYGNAQPSQIGSQAVTLGMGRSGGLRLKRLAQRSTIGNAGQQLAVRASKQPLRAEVAGLPRLRVN